LPFSWAPELARLGDRLDLRLNAPVQQVDRHPAGVTLRLASGEAHFDQVIFACHSAQALAMLAAPTDSEREVLGDIGWQRNEAPCPRLSVWTTPLSP
ncbi:FAD-dependent oxidoreductase, partial [Klebsiella pneumoniae]|uniref:FAD-dependent oxidoreductase n=1 Tax=Klebsiella pneumoniae TaxID=573 RepID=UPI002109013D